MSARRGSGEGTIYRTADGRWRSVVDLGWHGGKRRRRYLSGRTRTEVAAKLRKALERQEGGLEGVRDGRLPTVEEWLAYLPHVVSETAP